MGIPAKNISVLFAGRADRSEEAATLSLKYGIEIIFFPAFEIIPVEDRTELEKAISELEYYHYLIFTSANAVDYFAAGLKEFNASLKTAEIAAVGKKTEEACREHGFVCSVIPDDSSANGLIEKFKELKVSGKKFLIPCSSIARDELKTGLEELGAFVNSVPVYQTVLPSYEHTAAPAERIKFKPPDWYVFTSPSAFNNFLTIMKIGRPAEYFDGSGIAAIGKTTAAAIENVSVNVNFIPGEPSVEAIMKFIGSATE